MPENQAKPTIADRRKEYPSNIPSAAEEEAERVSTHMLTMPVSRFACIKNSPL